MSNFIKSYQANVGLNHVPAYQVSGQPFATGSITIDYADPAFVVRFPYVTRWVQIVAHTGSADDIRIGFSAAGVSGSGASNFFRMHVNNTSNQIVAYDSPLEMKVSELWFYPDSAGDVNFDVVAGLTSIPTSRVTTEDGPNWSGSAGVG